MPASLTRPWFRSRENVLSAFPDPSPIRPGSLGQLCEAELFSVYACPLVLQNRVERGLWECGGSGGDQGEGEVEALLQRR